MCECVYVCERADIGIYLYSKGMEIESRDSVTLRIPQAVRIYVFIQVSTFELRSRIAFRLDSLEQGKHLERIEISNSILESMKKAQY